MYRKVNFMFGDVIKVTPSSKIVGDMAMFMVQNNLEPEDVFERGDELTFPQGVVDFFKGMIGQPASCSNRSISPPKKRNCRPNSVAT